MNTRKHHVTRRLLVGAVLIWLGCTTQALANPEGGVVTHGSATIANTSPTRVEVTQHSSRAVINWDRFNIAQNEHTSFAQPSSRAVVLNRVQGGGASQILGRMTANGQVYIVNGAGVMIGRNAKIDVAGLMVTTADVSSHDFMAGRYDFNIPGQPGAGILNEGQITAAEGGLVAMVAPWVQNDGLIAARLGKVALASGETFTLDLYGDDLIRVATTDELARQLTHTGTIQADGGTVWLDAQAAGAALDGAICMDGIIEARGIATDEAGRVMLTGDKIELTDRSSIDVSADQQDAGTIYIYGNDCTWAEGVLLARSDMGDGGFVEVSATNDLHFMPAVDAMSTYGQIGTLLLDPATETINAGNKAAIENAVAHVNVQATNDIVLDTDLAMANPNINLTLDAPIITMTVNATAITTQGGDFATSANSVITSINNLVLTTNHGDVTLGGPWNTTAKVTIDANTGGDVIFNNNNGTSTIADALIVTCRDFTNNGVIDGIGGELRIQAGRHIDMGGACGHLASPTASWYGIIIGGVFGGQHDISGAWYGGVGHLNSNEPTNLNVKVNGASSLAVNLTGAGHTGTISGTSNTPPTGVPAGVNSTVTTAGANNTPAAKTGIDQQNNPNEPGFAGNQDQDAGGGFLDNWFGNEFVPGLFGGIADAGSAIGEGYGALADWLTGGNGDGDGGAIPDGPAADGNNNVGVVADAGPAQQPANGQPLDNQPPADNSPAGAEPLPGPGDPGFIGPIAFDPDAGGPGWDMSPDDWADILLGDPPAAEGQGGEGQDGKADDAEKGDDNDEGDPQDSNKPKDANGDDADDDDDGDDDKGDGGNAGPGDDADKRKQLTDLGDHGVPLDKLGRVDKADSWTWGTAFDKFSDRVDQAEQNLALARQIANADAQPIKDAINQTASRLDDTQRSLDRNQDKLKDSEAKFKDYDNKKTAMQKRVKDVGVCLSSVLNNPQHFPDKASWQKCVDSIRKVYDARVADYQQLDYQAKNSARQVLDLRDKVSEQSKKIENLSTSLKSQKNQLDVVQNGTAKWENQLKQAKGELSQVNNLWRNAPDSRNTSSTSTQTPKTGDTSASPSTDVDTGSDDPPSAKDLDAPVKTVTIGGESPVTIKGGEVTVDTKEIGVATGAFSGNGPTIEVTDIPNITAKRLGLGGDLDANAGKMNAATRDFLDAHNGESGWSTSTGKYAKVGSTSNEWQQTKVMTHEDGTKVVVHSTHKPGSYSMTITRTDPGGKQTHTVKFRGGLLSTGQYNLKHNIKG
jgi:filamentous hemagglutinin family protein